MKHIISGCILVLILVWAGWLQAAQEHLEHFQSRVTEFSLENGMQFLVIERDQAPVVSFVTMIKVGSKQEPAGKTGLAHFLEHMAFKGTRQIGTRNWQQEQELLQSLDQAYAQWQQARENHGKGSKQSKKARAEFEDLQDKAGQLVISNEFSRIIEQHGGEDLNAATSKDYTLYHCSLPANKAELWFSLESDRLLNPVWREFYSEKQVILEERRTRVDSNPQGRLLENLLAQAYQAHPYRHPVLGWESDIQAIQRKDLDQFYSKYYQARNITVAIAGDVKPGQMEKLARQYFAELKPGSPAAGLATQEPEQRGRREFFLQEDHEPVLVRAYHTVQKEHADYLPLQVLAKILSQGRTSRLQTSLVQDQALAQEVFAMQGYPGQADPALFLLYAQPGHQVELQDLIQALDQELEKIRQEGIQQEELQRAKTNIRAELVRSLDSNLGLARSFAQAQAFYGDWRLVFSRLDELQKVSSEQVMQVARMYLQPKNSTQGRIVSVQDRER